MFKCSCQLQHYCDFSHISSIYILLATKRLNAYGCTVCICSQNKSAYCVKAAARSCPPPEAGVGSGRLTGKEVKSWGRSQRLGSLGKYGKDVQMMSPTY